MWLKNCALQPSFLLLQTMGITLIAAATEDEISALRSTFSERQDVVFLILGVGMVNATFNLTNRLTESDVERVINVGIAGSFDRSLKIGDVVQVIEERFSELGAEDNGQFIAAEAMGLMPAAEVEFRSELRFDGLPAVSGITVNTIHGEEESIQNVIELFKPDIEGMEGASVAFVAQKFGVKWAEIRAISNYVEPRNRVSWQVELTIDNLTETLTALLQKT